MLLLVSLRRKGELGAEQFLSRFRRLCGAGQEADAVLEQLASLLPAAEQQLALEAALDAERGPGGAQKAEQAGEHIDVRINPSMCHFGLQPCGHVSYIWVRSWHADIMRIVQAL
jgi:hypothetical protein